MKLSWSERKAEADAHVRAVLGDGYAVVNVSGYWVVGTRSPRFERVSPDPLRKSYVLAVSDVQRALVLQEA